jgi:hypothetical protein
MLTSEDYEILNFIEIGAVQNISNSDVHAVDLPNVGIYT